MSATVITLTNSKGFAVTTASIGGVIVGIKLPNGTQVALGFENLADYETNAPYIGCTVGRCTNRTANAQFAIDGQVYPISANAPPNHLHGGAIGFNKANWTVQSNTDTTVTYKMISPNGDQGYPGEVEVIATYTVTEDNEIYLEYCATTDAPTPINLTNHCYFNLAGKGDILDHVLILNADLYTPVGEGHIPTGEIASVEGTPLDFRKPHSIRERYTEVSEVGYDNNFCLNSAPTYPADNTLHFAAKLQEPTTHNILEVYTNQSCVQLYQGGYLDGSYNGLDGKPILKYTGLCLETQKHPDAINQPNFPSTLLRPGEKYYSKTVWKFTSE